MQLRARATALMERFRIGMASRAHSADLAGIERFIAEMEAKAPHTDSLYDDIRVLESIVKRAFGAGRDVPDDALHRTMFDLPVDPVEAMVQLGIRRAVNARLQAGWYRERLVFLINAEKSSSTLHEIVIRDMLLHSLGMRANFGIQRGLRYGPTELASESTMHGMIPMYAPDGGVIRSPYLPTPGNVRYVKWLGARVVLLTRHPADRIVARACMNKDAGGAGDFDAQLEAGTAFDRYFEIRSNASLRYDIEWMAGWLVAFGSSDRMHVVRYEDMMDDPWRHFDGIHRFLAGTPLDSELRALIADRMARTKSGGDLQPGAVDGRSYPRGYSGKVGVWRDYFAAKDVERFNQIVGNYLEYEPHAKRLLDIYPDIVLEPAVEPTETSARTGEADGGSGGANSLRDMYEQLDGIEREALAKPSIREDAEHLREAARAHFGARPELPEGDRHRLMYDLATEPVEGAVQLGLRLATNARLMNGWYADRLVFLVVTEKSSSTLHEIAIREMQRLTLGQEANFGIQHGLRYGPTELAYGCLHGLLPLYAPDGGVLRGPFLPTFGNVRFLRELGTRVVLLCRHPADRVVARGCMAGAGVELTIRPDEVESGEVFLRLIRDRSLPPSLDSELAWLTGWLEAMGGSDRVLLLRYEDMVADPRAHFERLHRFVTGQAMGPPVWDVLQSAMAESFGGALQPGDRAARHYPKGYTGAVGVWRDYFTPDHVGAYNAVVERFMAWHPRAHLLREVYPDIRLD